ncbi:MAG: DNA alkylation repair protein [Acidimicrobiales bacterium]
MDDVRAGLAAAADPRRAPAMAAYMRDQFPFFGVTAPERRRLLRAASAEVGPLGPDDVLAAARDLWLGDERELQYAGMDLLRAHARSLPTEALPALAWCATTKPWWDTVDDLAQHTIGALVLADRGRLRPVLDAWAAGPDLWLARTAILHQNRYRDDVDDEQLFAYCTLRAGDTDFFIRKAIGWALRERSRRNPDGVERFVHEHRDELSGLSRREALKHLAPTER